MGFLRDPIWQFFGAVIACIAIGITLYLFILQRNKKALSYQVLTRTELLSVNKEIEGKIKIMFENMRVRYLHLVVIKVINDGNVPISVSDFFEPLIFSFGENARVLDAEVIEVFPKTLKPIISIEDKNRIKIEPSLFNSKDNFKIKLLIAQFGGYIEYQGRISGIGEIKEIVPKTLRQITSIVIQCFGLIFILVGLGLEISMKAGISFILITAGASIVALGGIFLTFLGDRY